MIELMVVIAIIATLATLLIIGIRHISGSAKENATKADLGNLRAMFDEFNAGGGTSRYPAFWLWRAQATQYIDASSAAATANQVDFWGIPWRTGPNGPGFVPICMDSLDAPNGLLTPDNPVARNASRAVLNTQLAMRYILSIPANKAALAKIPVDRLMVPDWMSGTLPSTLVTGKDGITNTTDDGGDNAKDIVYCEGNCVRYQGVTYRCIKTHVASSGPQPPAPTQPPALPAQNTTWEQDPNPTPLILDAWGNPLVFVPASGLINVRGNLSAGANGATVTGICKKNGVPVTPAPGFGVLPPVLSPEAANGPNYNEVAPGDRPQGRPFFASAGPDGDLSTGDDNVYSFEK